MSDAIRVRPHPFVEVLMIRFQFIVMAQQVQRVMGGPDDQGQQRAETA
ncbi:hypothetical protein [Brevundimonas sp.]